ncbi:filamentous hemagglutinin N-terminal domain-containing protein [Undibacterium sp. CY18W]|uniref:Filamentous hemagglutinin N-terminal domain-containing protein n=1 Tax=Undibacterium hunanense TaxID=2762292 RepID=A0ABR6ZSI1_9BURK|nr:filamentous hemagglutinin N-terminal domain-containing protein [Undibacterium hunanense]MBC3918774.1 filamentous hemagglutinin N-terminal domain-containing protein [Undibacterium hunanense]
MNTTLLHFPVGQKRRKQTMRAMHTVICISLLFAFGTTPLLARAGAVTDGTVGPVQNLSGNFVIPQNLGTTKGANLFHSFRSFSIDSGESANFTTTTALQNVIARVTGGPASQINGLLQLTAATGSQPNFYFINPAGVIFGAGAALDVPAGLHISTANYLKFSDGNFYVDATRASTLSAAAPEAFGFLGSTRATLELRDGATLSTRSQQVISLIAGDISIDNASLQAPGGNIRVAAVGSGKLDVSLAIADVTGMNGRLAIVNGGSVNSPGSGFIDGGQIRIQAGDIVIDAQGGRQDTGVFSNAKDGIARSGDIQVSASGQLSILNGARISSSTFTNGNAGAIRIDADTAVLDGQGQVTGIYSQANDFGGNAGNLDIHVKGKLAVLNGGLISSSSNARGNAGTVVVSAGEIMLDGSEANGPDTGIVSTANTGSSNSGSGNAGKVDVSASGKLTILSSAQISSATYTAGQGGDVKVSAGELLINGDGLSTGINSISGGKGNAGNVDVAIRGTATMQAEGGISTSAFDRGNAGIIKFQSDSLVIDGQGLSAGIYSDAGDFRMPASFQGGNGGNIDVSVADRLMLTDGGRISSTTYTRGNSGNISIVGKNVSISGGESGVRAETIGVGNGGSIQVQAGQSVLLEAGGSISSSTRFIGNAGAVRVDAAAIDINGKGQATGIYSDAGTQAQGNAGSVDVNVSGKLSLTDGGQISSATISYSTGSAGAVKVIAGSLDMDGKPTQMVDAGSDRPAPVTGILSSANAGDEYTRYSVGNAGTVNVNASSITMRNAAQISSSAFAKGKAGAVNVSGGIIDISNHAIISSEAGPASSGYAGSVNLAASESLHIDQGILSISNAARPDQPGAISKTLLAVNAPDIQLQQAQISASASGNVAASDIRISYASRFRSRASAITTSAQDGNGGNIVVRGSGPLLLDSSQLTTSVNGLQTGNGGDISITAPALVLRNGFVQANTAAPAASGGNVNVQVDATIATGNQLRIGGPPLSFSRNSGNLIQAAAPDGVNGVIRLSSPQVDFAASLLTLSAQAYDLGDLTMDLCRIGNGSSLSPVGRGGLLPTATGLLKP